MTEQQPQLPPSPDEILAAIAAHRDAKAAMAAAYEAEMAAREVLVDVLRRAGVEGFNL